LENAHLRAAIARAGLTLEEFADIVQVDVKTVQRWLAGRATPYRRHRSRVAAALETTEHALWPDVVAAPAATEALEQKTTISADTIAGYGHASDPAAPTAAGLLGAAVERIELVIPSLTSQAGLVELIGGRTARGCRARIILERPDSEVEPLLGIEAIEVRASPMGEGHAMFRADEEMLLLLTGIGSAGVSPPIIHLRRQANGGLFDRVSDDFEDRWLEATPITSREQLDTYTADRQLAGQPGPLRLPEADPPPPSATTPMPADAPRRWPRRPT